MFCFPVRFATSGLYFNSRTKKRLSIFLLYHVGNNSMSGGVSEVCLYTFSWTSRNMLFSENETTSILESNFLIAENSLLDVRTIKILVLKDIVDNGCVRVFRSLQNNNVI